MTKWLYKNVVFRNLVFYVLIGCLFIAVNVSELGEEINKNSFFLVELLGFYTATYLLCYFHNKVLYERFLNRKKFSVYFFLSLAAVLIWTLLLESTHPFSLEDWTYTFFLGFLMMFFGFGLYMIFQSVFVEQWKLRNSLTNTQNELAQLRAQLNPHFLFNALNNLYGVSVSEPEKVSGYVLMLSDLLRYQVDGSKQERVKLSDELRFIEQFIQYEKLKLAHRGKIELSIEVPANSLLIAPLILFQFVENAFKFSGQKAKPWVIIHIRINGNQLFFDCSNTFNQEFRKKSMGTQTGLVNVSQRLELQYPMRHALKIHEGEEVYKVQLEINLADDKI